MLPFIIRRNKRLRTPSCSAARRTDAAWCRSCLVPRSEVPLGAAPVENSIQLKFCISEGCLPQCPEPVLLSCRPVNPFPLPPAASGMCSLLLPPTCSGYCQHRIFAKHLVFVEIFSLDQSSIFLGFSTLSELPSARCYRFAFSPRLSTGLHSFCFWLGFLSRATHHRPPASRTPLPSPPSRRAAGTKQTSRPFLFLGVRFTGVF